MMTTYKLVKFPALVIAFRNLLLRMNLTLNLETKDFSIVFQLSNRLFTNKVAYFFFRLPAKHSGVAAFVPQIEDK